MKRLVIAVSVLACGVTAGRVRADSLTALDCAIEGDALAVNLVSSGELHEPVVKSSPGLLQLWFAGMDAVSRLDGTCEGTTIRAVRVRPGYEDTALVQLVTTGGFRIDETLVRTERAARRTTIRLPLSALPPRLTPQVTAALPGATGASTAPRVEAPRTASAEPSRTGESPALPLVRSENTKDRRTRDAGALPTLRTTAVPGTEMLVVIAVALGLVYALVRWLAKSKNRLHRTAGIEILAVKRLGARHQLLVVRALGKDHLLAVHAGQAQRIASVPSRTDGRPGKLDGMFDRFDAPGGEGRSGDHLSFARELRGLSGRLHREATSDAHPESDSVSGLLRLRQQLGQR